jgi:cell filamentation protein
LKNINGWLKHLMSDKYAIGQDPYCYRNSRVLKNKFNLHNDEILKEAEREITTLALQQIKFAPPPYDLNYLRTIHRLLFANLYDWAGELRSIKMSKFDTVFCIPERIEPEAHKIFQTLEKEDCYIHNSHQELVKNMAELYAELNMIHPFREGNGRTQRIFFEHLALNCGYAINWGVVSNDHWIKANIDGVNCDYQSLQNVFESAITKIS